MPSAKRDPLILFLREDGESITPVRSRLCSRWGATC